MSFRISNNATSQLTKFCKHDLTQSRALLFIGKTGWGKFSSGIDFAKNILNTDPLASSDFFCFRNDHFTLKTEFFLTKIPHSREAWEWLFLLQRRINISKQIDETLSTGAKLGTIKEQFDEYLALQQFPVDQKFISQLINLCESFDKKSGIPINVIREAVAFHSVHSNHGRVSILGDFDTADETTQNAALKLLEEPHPNHWVILTAENTKNIIQTILSRTIKINFTVPNTTDLSFLGSSVYPISTINIMKESLFKISAIKKQLLDHFFNHCVNQVDQNVNFLQFTESLAKQNQATLFLEELLLCFEDAFIIRQNQLRGLNLPLRVESYRVYSSTLSKATVAEF
ncbi:MAG: hypothetical protein ACRCV0_02035 [Brevinema sp.]